MRLSRTRPPSVFFVVAFFCLATGCRKAETPSTAPAAKTSGKTADPGEKNAKDAKEDSVASLPEVKAEVARIGVIEKVLPLSGILTEPRDQEVTITAPVAGVLEHFPIRVGEGVSKGEILASLSTAPLLGQIEQARAGIAQYKIAGEQAQASALQQQAQTRASILQAQSAVSAAHASLLGAQATLTADQAAVTGAQQSLTRAKTLNDQGLVARKDVETAELAAQTAAAQVEAQKQTIAGLEEALVSQRQALAAAPAARLQNTVKQKDIEIARAQRQNAEGTLSTVEAQIALYTIRAPISGVVSAINAARGESVDTTTKIAVIENIDYLQLNVAVPSASSGRLSVGQPVVFTTDALPGRTFRSAIATIGTQVDPTNGTVSIVANVGNPDHLLKDDMSVHAGLVLARHKSALLVPRSAVFFTTGGDAAGGSGESVVGAASVMKIDSEGVLHKVSVITGLSEDSLVEIVSGLKPGDRVVSTGGYGLDDGTKVKTAEESGETVQPGAGSKDR